jgi:outer membrane receptor protein involved in Fe transport
MRLEGYYNVTDNYISSEDHTYPQESYADNIDKVWTKGAELEVNRSGADGIGFRFNYNFYLIDWFDDSLEIKPFLMELTPRHRINSGITWAPWHTATLSLESRAAFGRLSKSGLAMEDYVVLNAGIEQRFLRQALAVTIRVDNILDKKYQEIYGYPMPGRTFAMHASLAF